MSAIGATLLVFTLVFAAPLVIGSYVVAQRASPRVLLMWFGFLTAILVFGLVVGAIALVTLPL